ncbi:hypothetical protein [Gemmata sp.]|uniref:hypothetical protein n=1 Tax=Gemmata sp. TaxID=1914242 RepID=UPI003F723B93
MNQPEAHARFALMTDRSFLEGADETGDAFPAVATALADLSGWLDAATGDGDLRDAARHGESLYRSGVLSPDEVAAAANDVIAAVMRSVEAEGLHLHPHQEATPCTDS